MKRLYFIFNQFGILLFFVFIAGCGGCTTPDTEPSSTLPESGERGIGRVKALDLTRVQIDSRSGLHYVGDQILITFLEATPLERVNEIISGIQGEIVGFLNGFDDYQILLPDTASYDALLALSNALESNPEVVVATPHLVNRAPVSVPPDDPWISGEDDKLNQWSENSPGGNNWGLEVIKAQTGWAQLEENAGSTKTVNIGVIESGGFSNDNDDVSFEELGSAQSISDENFKESGLDKRNICNDSSPKRKSCRFDGKNIVEFDFDDFEVVETPDCSDRDPLGEHGMHVSGIIAAKQNNHMGIAGVAWHSDLYGFRLSQAYDVKAGVLWLAHQGVKVVNLSFGVSSQYRDPENKCKFDSNASGAAADAARESRVWGIFANRLINKGIDVLLVKAAGNDAIDSKYSGGFASVPEASRKNILVVAALTEKNGDLRRAGFSNIGEIDIYAPGDPILSAITNNGFGLKKGTSMAAPFVAGTAAAMLSINPCLTATELRDALIIQSKDRSIDFDGRTSPILNMAKAVEFAVSGAAQCTDNTPDKNPATEELGALTPLKVIVSGERGNADEPVNSAEILAKRVKADGTGEEYVTGLSTDSQGKAEILVEPGTYSLLVSAAGYYAENGGASVSIDSINIVQGEPQTYRIKMVAFPSSISGLVIDGTTGDLISNARIVLELGSAIAQDLSTDDDGRFVVGLPDDLDHGRVSIQAPGYITDSIGFSKKELSDDEINVELRPLTNKIIPVVNGERLYHLGNDVFDGTYNSQFQISATGTEVTLQFKISDVQLIANTKAILHLKAKGVQSNIIKSYFYINGNKIDYLPRSPRNGSYEAVALDFELESAGLTVNSENILKIETAYYFNEFNPDGDHYDDFEITDIYLELLAN